MHVVRPRAGLCTQPALSYRLHIKSNPCPDPGPDADLDPGLHTSPSLTLGKLFQVERAAAAFRCGHRGTPPGDLDQRHRAPHVAEPGSRCLP